MSKIGFASLGCSKNLIDTEIMLGILQQAGHEIVHDETDADVVIVNTCGFIHDAQKESIRTILEMGQSDKKLVVTGCLVQRHREDLVKGLPEANALIGTTQWPKIAEVVEKVMDGERVVRIEAGDFVHEYEGDVVRYRTEFVPYGYLKISEGCNNRCAFCIIPKLRGDLVSRSIDKIVAEAHQMAADGLGEIIVVSQDTTAFGEDRGHHELPQLLRALGGVDARIRLLYCYPSLVTDEVLSAMRETPNILPYFDMPLQHAHAEILRSMGRPYKIDYREKISEIRAKIPNVVLRTTFIVGYPGETEEHFQALMDFVQEMKFDHIGVFTYSNEAECAAAKLPGHVPQLEKRRRRKALMELQREILQQKNQERIGQVVEVLVEGAVPSKGEFFGRAFWDAPEVDGMTYAKGDAEPGDIVPVRITRVDAYDSFGEVAVGVLA